MKKNPIHNVSTMSPQCLHNKTGSILIWSVLLGFLLTSVFFFFSMRQRENIAVQRDTADILNAKSYLESYADYLENLDQASRETLRDNGASFDNIVGTVTNHINEIVDIADFSSTKNYTFGGDIYVEWNKCPDSPNPNLPKGDLYVNNVLYKHDGDVCMEGEVYDDIIGPITVANPAIETLNNPFQFRITAKDSGTTLVDNKWHTDTEVDLGYGNKITINRTF